MPYRTPLAEGAPRPDTAWCVDTAGTRRGPARARPARREGRRADTAGTRHGPLAGQGRAGCSGTAGTRVRSARGRGWCARVRPRARTGLPARRRAVPGYGPLAGGAGVLGYGPARGQGCLAGTAGTRHGPLADGLVADTVRARTGLPARRRAVPGYGPLADGAGPARGQGCPRRRPSPDTVRAPTRTALWPPGGSGSARVRCRVGHVRVPRVRAPGPALPVLVGAGWLQSGLAGRCGGRGGRAPVGRCRGTRVAPGGAVPRGAGVDLDFG